MGIGKNIFRTVWGVSKLNIESQRLSKKLSRDLFGTVHIIMHYLLKDCAVFFHGVIYESVIFRLSGLLFQDSFLVGDMIITLILFLGVRMSDQLLHSNLFAGENSELAVGRGACVSLVFDLA
jgi:hypothetical protein